MDDGLSAGGQQGEPTDSLEVFASRSEPPPVEYVPSQPPPLGTSLSPKMQNKMTRSIVEIFELEGPSKEGVEMGDDEEEHVVDLDGQRRRTERLKEALPALAQLWWCDSDQMDLVAEKLGDGSRDRKPLLFLSAILLAILAHANCTSCLK